MKYFLDTEFIEGFRKPHFGKKRWYIDLISIGIVCEDGREYYAISSEYNFNDASFWVKENVIGSAYLDAVHGDARNRWGINNFHKAYGKPLEQIRLELLEFTGCWRDQHFWRAPSGPTSLRTPEGGYVDATPGFYGYFADYDWVLFCSLFGRMVDLPKGFPMWCNDLRQDMQRMGLSETWKLGTVGSCNAHIAIEDARWTMKLYQAIKKEYGILGNFALTQHL